MVSTRMIMKGFRLFTHGQPNAALRVVRTDLAVARVSHCRCYGGGDNHTVSWESCDDELLACGQYRTPGLRWGVFGEVFLGMRFVGFYYSCVFFLWQFGAFCGGVLYCMPCAGEVFFPPPLTLPFAILLRSVLS
jgi:hypothetical protein